MSTDRAIPLHALAEALAQQPGASMEQLAQAIGVSRATLHRMVSSRDDLINKLEQFAYETCVAAFAEVELNEGPADETLDHLITALNPNASLFLFLHRHRFTNGCSRLKHEWQEQRKVLVAFFQRGQEQGAFRVDVPAQWLVDVLAALLHAAAEAVYDQRLARADMDHVVCAVLRSGVTRKP